MFLHAASVLRPRLNAPHRAENPSPLMTALAATAVVVAGVVVYKWWEDRGSTGPHATENAKSEWIYWAALHGDYWLPWLQRPDGTQAPAKESVYPTREEAEEVARDIIIAYGGVPVLSYGPPGNEDATPGLEGAAPAPKKNYVGTGWFWPHSDIFTTEGEILRYLSLLGYNTAGNEVLLAQNMDAVRRFQGDYNLVATLLATGTQLDSDWPAGLAVDGLLGTSSLQALYVVLQAMGAEETNPKASWRTVVNEGKRYIAIPLAIKQLLRLGYGEFAQWMAASSAQRKAIVRPFQTDYNCVIQTTTNSPITVDGQVGPQSKAALAYASAIDVTVTPWVDLVAAC